MNDLLLRAARGENVERAPVWAMRQAGRYLPEYQKAKGDRDFFQVCRDPELASTITLQPVERYSGLIDAAIIFSDILVVPQAMGMRVEMREGKGGPYFPDPIRDPKEIAHKLKDVVDTDHELSYVFDAIRLTRKRLAGRVPLIGFCGAPWTLMVYMLGGSTATGFAEGKSWLQNYPSAAKDILQRIAKVDSDYLVGQVLAGAQYLQVFDSWAGYLSKDQFLEFSLPYLREISRNVKEKLAVLKCDVPICVFAKGANDSFDELCDAGYDVVSIDWNMSPSNAVRLANKRVTIQGNMDPSILLQSHESITEAVKTMVAGFGGGHQYYIANLGHGITPQVDPENLRHFFTEIHRFSSL